MEKPSITAPANVTVNTDPGKCTTAVANVNLGTPETSDNCGVQAPTNDALANFGATGFPKGTSTVHWQVKDTSGNPSNVASQTVTVEDHEKPIVTCSVAQGSLSPPNHDLVNVGLAITATDNCEVASVQTFVYADEDDEMATGDGTHSPDAKNAAAGTLVLRSERRGDADGRVYVIVILATDGSGNVGSSCCTVTVARDQSAKSQQSVSGQAAGAQAQCAAFAAHAQGLGSIPAGFFVVGDGPTIGPKQ